jgi:signal peptidase
MVTRNPGRSDLDDELLNRHAIRKRIHLEDEDARLYRGWTGWLGSFLLNLAALGGLVCIVLVILAWVFNISLIMFKTGSMSPTIPAGSLAVVREIPAAEIKVGDVITVDREGNLPVTHRVTSIDLGASEGQRILTMRGDANSVDDPFPYVVDTARSTFWHMPGLAKIVVWFGNPWVLGSFTIAAALLVTWSFWPRESGSHRDGTP